jgi:hypothetical protein
MQDEALDWRDLEEEMLRPIPVAMRGIIEVIWEQWPGPYRQKKALASLTDEELYDFLSRGLQELERRVEGPMNAALLLRRLARGSRETKSEQQGDRRTA